MTNKSPPPPNRTKTKSPVNYTTKHQSSAPVRLKTVVRRLPPNLPETVFWQSVEPWVSDETAVWKIFYQGKLRKKLNKENIPSRAYILFKNEELLALFSREYDGHLFRDKQGNESQAVVEFAPNQKTPPEKKKSDSRHATIQQDEDFLSFVASLQNAQAKSTEVDIDALLAATQTPEEPKTTPLLAALREQKMAAHDKKMAAEAAKGHWKKGPAAALPAQKSETESTAQPTGKKSKKGKGAQAAAASTSSAPAPPNPPTKPSRNRPNRDPNNPTGSTAPAPTPTVISSTSKETSKETGVPGDEASQRRNRPMLGLQSRHLKAALTGAGVAMGPASPSGSSPISLPASGSAPAGSSGPRPGAGRGGGGSDKRAGEKAKDGASKASGGGRGGGGGGGKDKTRSRQPPSGGPPTVLARPPDPTPRILSRQDTTAAAFDTGDAPVAASGFQEGRGRGRGGRRGRGQS